jgi:DNA-binding HxlR family transcriptional regulator
MRRFLLALIPLVVFASSETVLAVLSATSYSGPIQKGNPSILSYFWTYAPHISILSWTIVGATIWLGRSGKGIFARQGFDNDVYKLMIKMRGSGRRLQLLRNLEEPKHRFELAKVTGMDWKEVDRQLRVLENYGLARVIAQSGTVKMYQITEQGRVLVKLISDLANEEKAQQTY